MHVHLQVLNLSVNINVTWMSNFECTTYKSTDVYSSMGVRLGPARLPTIGCDTTRSSLLRYHRLRVGVVRDCF